ncbi:tetratricopeptide repeat protein, partial [bacterium]|nr:tetratricopeptide repeat protein [bacterium]
IQDTIASIPVNRLGYVTVFTGFVTHIKKQMLIPAVSLMMNGRNEEALARLQKSREMDPSMCGTPINIAYVHRSMGKMKEAIAELQSPLGQDWCSGGWGKSELGYTYGVIGNKVEAEKLLMELKEASKHRYIPNNYIGVVYLGLGDKDQALFWFEKGLDEGTLWLSDLMVHMPQLRSDPNFEPFLRRVNLSKN